MEVIITHLNADFDSLGAMVAAQRLYPQAMVVFPGSQEKSLRDFLIRSTLYMLNIKKLKEVDVREIKRLIVVDTRQRSRIGAFAALLDDPSVEVHVYDHHPPSPDDFSGKVELVEQRGATTTIMVGILKERGISVTPIEATVMLLGIYEDTGSFTFPSTTPQDLEAAAYLLSNGADLRVVTEMMTKEMTAEQVRLLNQMLENAEHYTINGLDVLVTTASSEEYLQDAALLVHKLRAMEMPDALFALLRMGDRIVIVARSRVEQLDVSKVCMEFGGGGHPTAASATVKDMTLNEVKDRLLGYLSRQVKPKFVAKDIMTTPLKTISPDTTLREAHEVMSMFALGVLPVTSGDRFLGLILWEDVEKGVLHGLGSKPVRDFMRIDVPQVSPGSPLSEVYELLMTGNYRLLPVLEGERLIGGITKGDLLRALEPLTLALEPRDTGARRRNIKALLEEKLSPELLDLLREIGKVAEGLGMKAYLVGGFVRDLFLGRKNMDLDVVVEGNGIAFAEALGQKLNIAPTAHRPMGTATLWYGGFRVDVATARIEYYPKPASPPRVEKGSLKRDLYRRDFTINTLAIALNPEAFGELIDYFGGQKDLKERTLRVLHGMSFVEDPSRIFRALRFEVRFGFKLGKQTESLMKAAISSGYVHKLSGHRLLAELSLIFGEENPVKILERMEELGLLRVLHPKLSLDHRIKELLRRTSEVINWYELLFLAEKPDKVALYLMTITEGLGDEEKIEVMDRLQASPRLRKKVVEERREGKKALWNLQATMNAWEVYSLLEPFSLEVLLFLMALEQGAEKRRLLAEYISRSRHIKPQLRGEDLKAMGITPGPHYQQIYRRLLQARLLGEVEKKEDEVELVRREFEVKMIQQS